MKSARKLPLHPTFLLSAALVYLADMNARARQVRAENPDAGNVITDNLAWIVFGVIAIVAIGALISGLGKTVVSWVQSQRGV